MHHRRHLPSHLEFIERNALDMGNQLEFLRGGSVVGTFARADLIAALGACTASNPYCGNPRTRRSSGMIPRSPMRTSILSTQAVSSTKSKSPRILPSVIMSLTITPVAYCGDVQACISGKVVTTPEPSSMVLLGAGLLSLLALSLLAFEVRSQRHALPTAL